MKVQVIKASADGEQISMEVNVPSDIYKEAAFQGKTDRLEGWLFPVFHIADKRLLEMNQRVAAAKHVRRSFPPEVMLGVDRVLEIIHGNVPTEQIKQMLGEARQEAVDREAAIQAKAQTPLTAAPSPPAEDEWPPSASDLPDANKAGVEVVL